MPVTERQHKANRRLGWTLAALALAFAGGFVLKILLIGG
ncbi:MAG: cytochrome oxidase small assembly protein [Burkholderiaceae bacterium]|nr:cytochrome oxidase small assembly protein [Burkholderiaceae bacterium]